MSCRSYTWKIYANKVLNMGSAYGFWRQLNRDQKHAKQRYLQMFYNLQFRNLVSLLTPTFLPLSHVEMKRSARWCGLGKRSREDLSVPRSVTSSALVRVCCTAGKDGARAADPSSGSSSHSTTAEWGGG